MLAADGFGEITQLKEPTAMTVPDACTGREYKRGNAGVAATHVGLHRSALAYCAAIAVLAAVAAGSLIFRSRSAIPPQDNR